MSRETGEFKRKHLLTQTQYRSSSQIGDVLSFIVSKKKRSNKNKKKRGLFSRMFSSASDSKKAEEKEAAEKAAAEEAQVEADKEAGGELDDWEDAW